MLVAVSALMTVGVYGLVAGIVKLDDLGLALARRPGRGPRALGRAILAAAPWLMKALSFLGTAAMFMVGGGILAHGVPALHWVKVVMGGVDGLSAGGRFFHGLATAAFDGAVGLVAGALALALVLAVKRLRKRKKA